MPKVNFPAVPATVTHKNTTARKYTGRGTCWMHGEITRAPATWETCTKCRDGNCYMLLCDSHFKQFADEAKPRIINDR